jgi:hypothetical protein
LLKLTVATRFYPGKSPFKPLIRAWDARGWTGLQAEPDAAFFLLYGVHREDVECILWTFNGIPKESQGTLPGTTSPENES